MKKKYSGLSLAAMWVFGFAAAVLCGTLLLGARFGGMQGVSSASKYATIYRLLDERYVGQADMNEVSDYACYAMVAATGDKWSRYMSAEEYAEYRLFQQNSYKGIGVTVKGSESEDDFALITGLTEDSPAQQAGVKIGDYMLSIDGERLRGMAATEIKTLIEQRTDTEFELTVLRGKQELKLRITAGVVASNPVEYELLDNKTGYIRIKNFEERAGAGTVAAVDDLVSKGAKAIAIDVRCNPGGQLTELIAALDHLVPEGDVFISQNVSGEETVKRSDAEFVDIPLAVLIDENSYSAAEFFAAALKEYDRAVLVGQQTTGKSRSQINIELSDGSAVHLSVNRYLTPKRVDLTEAGGLTPDIEAELPEELLPYLAAGELSHGEDAQLQAALETLSERR